MKLDYFEETYRRGVKTYDVGLIEYGAVMTSQLALSFVGTCAELKEWLDSY